MSAAVIETAHATKLSLYLIMTIDPTIAGVAVNLSMGQLALSLPDLCPVPHCTQCFTIKLFPALRLFSSESGERTLSLP